MNSFNMAYNDEDSILDQTYIKQTFSGFYYEDFKYLKWLKKIHIRGNTALYNKELMNLDFCATPMLVCIFV